MCGCWLLIEPMTDLQNFQSSFMGAKTHSLLDLAKLLGACIGHIRKLWVLTFGFSVFMLNLGLCFAGVFLFAND